MTEATRLLDTKIQVPPLPPNTLKRSRLLDALDNGLHPHLPLTLLSAPAGYGKTTLLSAWIEQRELPAAWISLDERDNDPPRFHFYLLSALQRQDADLASMVLPEGQHSPIEVQDRLLVPLVNQLGKSPNQTLLVLDDYHWIENQVVHDQIAFLLEHLPPQAHIFIASRADPPLPLSRLRGRGQLNELRMQDLQFRVDEVERFLRDFSDLDIPANEIEILARRTEGWIAGLQMAAASLSAQEDKSAFVQDFSGSTHYIMDYLVDEVLSRQSPELEAFLLHTSILDRMCAALCDAVLDGVDEIEAPSSDILNELMHRNLFLVALDELSAWYRYHRLFAELLRARLMLKDPDQVPVLHRRASEWFESQGLIEEAVYHALSSKDNAFAADVIERTSQEFLLRSETVSLLQAIQRLPEDELKQRPKLGIYRAWALLMLGAPMSSAQTQLEISSHQRGPPGSAESLQAFLAMAKGDMQHGVELAEQALAQLPEDEIYLRDFAALSAATGYISLGETERGLGLMEQTSQESMQSGNRSGSVLILTELAEFRFRQMELAESERLCRQALDLSTLEGGELLPIGGRALVGLGSLALERYDLPQAERLLRDGIRYVERWNILASLDGQVWMAMLHFAQGNTEALGDSLALLHELARRFDASELDDFMVDLFQANINVRRGNLEPVREWIADRGLEGAPGSKPPAYSRDAVAARLVKYELPVLARLYLADSRPDQALEVLEQITHMAEEARRPHLQVEAEILRARAFHHLGRPAESDEALTRALKLAAPERSMRLFLIDGDETAQLLRVGRSGFEPASIRAFVDQMLAKSKAPRPEPPTSSGGLMEPLSPRELEVLKLLPTRMTAEDIAGEMVISVNTVRSHMKSIYAKLAVHSRHEAVIRATELNLI